MDIQYKKIDLNNNFSRALTFRLDSFVCSFDSDEEFWKEAGEQGCIYRNKLEQRKDDEAWCYYHVWHAGRIIGQLEFRSFSDWDKLGYVHLFYLIPEYRGIGVFDQLHRFVEDQLIMAGCSGAVLTASKTNLPALKAYDRHGWYWMGPNPKHAMTDFYRIDFS